MKSKDNINNNLKENKDIHPNLGMKIYIWSETIDQKNVSKNNLKKLNFIDIFHLKDYDLKQIFSGGNPGHASISLEIPITKNNNDLIEECKELGIPYKRVPQNHGKPEHWQVYISGFPNNARKLTFHENLEEDMLEELNARPVRYSEKGEKTLGNLINKRKVKGIYFKRKISEAPLFSFHSHGLNKQKKDTIKTKIDFHKTNQLMSKMIWLRKTLENLEKTANTFHLVKLKGSVKKALNEIAPGHNLKKYVSKKKLETVRKDFNKQYVKVHVKIILYFLYKTEKVLSLIEKTKEKDEVIVTEELSKLLTDLKTYVVPSTVNFNLGIKNIHVGEKISSAEIQKIQTYYENIQNIIYKDFFKNITVINKSNYYIKHIEHLLNNFTNPITKDNKLLMAIKFLEKNSEDFSAKYQNFRVKAINKSDDFEKKLLDNISDSRMLLDKLKKPTSKKNNISIFKYKSLKVNLIDTLGKDFYNVIKNDSDIKIDKDKNAIYIKNDLLEQIHNMVSMHLEDCLKIQKYSTYTKDVLEAYLKELNKFKDKIEEKIKKYDNFTNIVNEMDPELITNYIKNEEEYLNLGLKPDKIIDFNKVFSEKIIQKELNPIEALKAVIKITKRNPEFSFITASSQSNEYNCSKLVSEVLVNAIVDQEIRKKIINTKSFSYSPKQVDRAFQFFKKIIKDKYPEKKEMMFLHEEKKQKNDKKKKFLPKDKKASINETKAKDKKNKL